MLRVGLTGGISSGKSTVAEIFARLGAKVIDIDGIARKMVRPGGTLWERVRETFGAEFFHSDGNIDRLRLRKAIFVDPENRRQLNAIVHPEVMREVDTRAKQIGAQNPDAILVVDAPLLLEVGASERFDCVVVVFVDEHTQCERLMRRDGLSMEEARQALSAQMELRQKVKKADYVINNSGPLEETEAQVAEVWRELLELARNRGREKGRRRRHGDLKTRRIGERKVD